MERETDHLATTGQSLTAQQILNRIREHFYQRDDGRVIRGLTRTQVIGRVHRTQRSHFGGDIHGVIEVPSLALVNRCGLNSFQPAQIVSDFEQALIDSTGERYPDARVIRCLFHWKQAIRMRMLALHISLTEISIAMEVGVLDMLTVLPSTDVDPAGIRFVQRKIRRRCREVNTDYSDDHRSQFWVYFRRIWLILFPVWNVYGMDLQVVSRTNNPLERFNRELNAAISTPHPSLSAFVGNIEGLSRRYVRLLDDITNRATAPPQGVVQIPIPIGLTRQGKQRRLPRRPLHNSR
ncbi:Hypothetical protein PHPALM_36597 [Phytophthora palmivora]|uniref:Uncharacterized protein n=1 Tax=Phytophthora palmivora TaxID=4796 RepID=A0A2P4WZK2_9STRA|nr:Hypothetical protein PHPALM_36597 [Phytophthora palmivora]